MFYYSKSPRDVGLVEERIHMSEVRLEKIDKYFGQFAAVKDVSLTFASQSTTCLLGPSGCGKTTLLRMIAGLDTVSSGKLWIGGQDVTSLSARRRNIAMVFQYPIIYRGLSVFENIELPLRELKLTPDERKNRVKEAVALLGLERGAWNRIQITLITVRVNG
jgi:ABC-type sugar transport system ATPase subunit